MTFTVNLNKDDYRAFRRFCRRRYQHTRLLILIMIAVVEILTWHGQKAGTPLSEKIISALMVPLMFGVFFGIFMLFRWILSKVTRSTFQQPVGPHEYEITASVFRERNEFGLVETPLDRIKTVGQTKDHVFVILLNGLGHIIPKREISPEELGSILEQLKGTSQPTPPPLPRSRKKGMPVPVLALVAFLIFMIGVFIIPGVRMMQQMGLRTVCSSTEAALVAVMKLYAQDHEGKYPVTFDDMVGNCLGTNLVYLLICPATDHHVGNPAHIHEWSDFGYVSGLTESDPPNCVLMFCLPENHCGEGANVGFLGRQVQWFPCKAVKETLGEHHQATFQELTNTPSLFYGTTNEVQLADLKKRAKIIWPRGGRR